MTDIREIINKITYDRLEDALNVSYKMINRAANTGAFPPAWYRVIKSECDAIGIECPMDQFGFKKTITPRSPPN